MTRSRPITLLARASVRAPAMCASPSPRSTHVANRSAGVKRLDLEVLGVHFSRLFRAAWTLCGSR